MINLKNHKFCGVHYNVNEIPTCKSHEKNLSNYLHRNIKSYF